ncbi:FadR/GntR family transcriptional regulator [Acidocella aminolytica]|jgi:DNA-binding FadR family transcriptional regulator|uniref:Transcriptional regulator GntR n=1 Tax=Acidocella aminolytica 101 = DSM 11237 TaxID=1120923 RepID=A0A0D6PCF8_9PROT|nr:FadR/GntR family transcriptional regulator [Acidocella aminolytica]GAN78888.1 transcriptional regulator GntR [Acidocella aminolytica 101 = DSM 11237]GBQ42310.1 transcriptional regulator [Acidocella aminolytica 101 = DSM 11237]SHE98509.1 DNA-binding transcriptional regulator, FadR family [Acidocella aminolytica 101 = DSM 11237]
MNDVTAWLSNAHPVDKKNAAETVFDDIRSAITSGRLPVGARLPSELQLARSYKVSRPVIREALRSLQTLGLTQTRTGSGTFVIMASPDPKLSYGTYLARDLVEARPHIEVPAAGWAALRRSESQALRLHTLCDKMEKQDDLSEWGTLDGEFHSLIIEASGNAVFTKVLGDIQNALMRQSALLNLMSHRREASNVEHRRIAQAIAAGSEQEAKAAMSAHLGQVKTVLSKIIGQDQTCE